MTLQETQLQDRARVSAFSEAGLLIVTEDNVSWKIPGGKIDPGESPWEAAVRELKEETSCKWSICREKLGVFEVKKGNGLIKRTHVFWVDLLGEPVSSNEIVDLKFTWEPESFQLCGTTKLVVPLLRERHLL